jgi:hypothetical protein
MTTLPHIIEIAAWIYVIKQILPIVMIPTILGACYVGMRFVYGDKQKANEAFMNAILKGLKDAVND